MAGQGANSLSRARGLVAAVGAALVALVLVLAPVVAQEAALALYSRKGTYDGVRFDLQNAIISPWSRAAIDA